MKIKKIISMKNTINNDCKHDIHKCYSKKIDKIQKVLLQKLNHQIQNVWLQKDISPK